MVSEAEPQGFKIEFYSKKDIEQVLQRILCTVEVYEKDAKYAPANFTAEKDVNSKKQDNSNRFQRINKNIVYN
ncbi:MAG: hypothetical protein ACJASB_003165 [Shewanella psychromarinicola]|jgi:hypothetical protein|uniref:hypothetical protein n=1 Tax=Shewanella psychromarinicola TaxID=2487742 RepID=UPI003EE9338F